MNNQVIEYIGQLQPGAPYNVLTQIYNSLTPDQRQQLVQYVRQGTGEAFQYASRLIQGARHAMNQHMQGRVNDYGREFGDHSGFRHATTQPPATMVQNDERAAPPGASADKRIAAEAAKTAQPGMSRDGVAHGETSISPYKSAIRSPWQPTVTCIHHFYAAHGSSLVTPTAPAVWRYRLNSIYDCRDTGVYADNEPPSTPVADAADGAVQTPTWRGYWSAYYNYWTVLSCKYRMRFKIVPADVNNKDVELMVYVYHHGIQNPPLFADPTATGNGTTLVEHQYRRQHKGMYYFPIRYHPDTGFNDCNQFDKNSCSGEWTPGSIQHEVQEDELHQVWQKITEVPPTREGLTFIVQRSPVGVYGGNVQVFPEISLEYTTQWKDLKRQFQYPTQISSTPAVGNAPAQTNP